MARILFLCPYTPLATKPRPYHFILHLAQTHEITLLHFSDLPPAALAERADYKKLLAACRRVEQVPLGLLQKAGNLAKTLFSSMPLRAGFYQSAEMRRRIDALVRQEKIEIVHVDRSRLAFLARDIRLPKILDLTDSISWYLEQCVQYAPVYQRPVYALEYARMKPYEQQVGQDFACALITSRLDKEYFAGSAFYERIRVAPNLVNCHEGSWRSVPAAPAQADRRLLLFGNLSYFPNVDAAHFFARQIFPLILKEMPDVRWQLVGNRPASSVVRLARHPNVTVSGFVPDLSAVIRAAALVVAPTRVAVGYPNKVAEALVYGKAVVSTWAGCRGLDGADSYVQVANSPDEFAHSVLRLLSDDAQRASLEQNAPRYAGEFLDPRLAAAALDNAYASL